MIIDTRPSRKLVWLLCKRPDLASFLPSIDLPIHIRPLTTGYRLVKCLRDRLSNRSNDGQMLPKRRVLAHATTKLHAGIYHFPSNCSFKSSNSSAAKVIQSEDMKKQGFLERFLWKKNSGATGSSKSNKNQRTKDSRQVG